MEYRSRLYGILQSQKIGTGSAAGSVVPNKSALSAACLVFNV
ncbi:MAG: hypothetical protein WBX25_28000 [Rhodomicrobium sp.]